MSAPTPITDWLEKATCIKLRRNVTISSTRRLGVLFHDATKQFQAESSVQYAFAGMTVLSHSRFDVDQAYLSLQSRPLRR
jgi:hypothetical protein